jgi:hypothetical protein
VILKWLKDGKSFYSRTDTITEVLKNLQRKSTPKNGTSWGTYHKSLGKLSDSLLESSFIKSISTIKSFKGKRNKGCFLKMKIREQLKNSGMKTVRHSKLEREKKCLIKSMMSKRKLIIITFPN